MFAPYDYSWDRLFDAALNDPDYLATIIDKHKPFLDGTDSIGESSILHYLAYDNASTSARILLEAGANPNKYNKNGESPLHWAVRMRSINVAMLLIEYGANVNHADLSGSTALHYACSFGTPEIIPLLLLGNCDTNLRDISNKTALNLAEDSSEGSHAACAMLLYRHQRDPQTAQQLMKHNNKLKQLARKKENKEKTLSDTRSKSERVLRGEASDKKADHIKPHADTARAKPLAATPLTHTPAPQPKREPITSTDPRTITKRPPKPAATAPPLAYYPSPKPKQSNSSRSSSSITSSSDAPNKRCMYPFTPESCDYWDVVISVEQCADCDSSHHMSVRHDADKYATVATDVLLSLLRQCVASKKFLRVFGLKCKPLDHTRIGALEVGVAVKVSSSFTDALERSTGDGEEGVIVGNKWMSKTIFSKLQTKAWPVTAAVKEDLGNFLRDVMQQHPWRDPNEKDEENEVQETRRGQTIESSYTQWLVRTSSTDVPAAITPDIWAGDPAHELYHKGLFLAPFHINYDRDQWERSAMQQFLVYDGRRHHRRLAVDANGPTSNPHSSILRMFSR